MVTVGEIGDGLEELKVLIGKAILSPEVDLEEVDILNALVTTSAYFTV